MKYFYNETGGFYMKMQRRRGKLQRYLSWTIAKQTHPSLLAGGLFDAPLSIQKGYEREVTPDEKFRELEVDHLFLVVHGIGESAFCSGGKAGMTGIKSFKESLETTRKLCVQQRMALDKEHGVEIQKRVEFLGVEWHDCKCPLLCSLTYHSYHRSDSRLTVQ